MRTDNNINMISAKKTDDLDDFPTPDPYAPLASSDWYPQDIPPYEDDIDINPNALDPVMTELTDDPTEAFGVSPLAFGRELGRTAIDEGWDSERDDEDAGYNPEDYRESIEDSDEENLGLAA